jgi:hypothetical protein
MKREDSIKRVDEIISRMGRVIQDLNFIKQDFIDVDEEYFVDDELPDKRSGMEAGDPEVIGYLGHGPMSRRIDILYVRDIDLFTKSLIVERGKLENIKRIKLIDKILP